jgi:hypothetical protein
MFRLFEDKVNCVKGKHALFARCIATFFITCRYDECLEELRKEGKRISPFTLMD